MYKGSSKSDVGIMAVVSCVYSYSRDEIFKRRKELTHVGGDEHPLRKSVVVQILFKQCEVLDIRSALWNIGYRVINNQRTVKESVRLMGN